MTFLIPKEEFVLTFLLVASNFVTWTHLKQNPLFLHQEEGSEQKYLEFPHCLFQKSKFIVLTNGCMLGGVTWATAHVWWYEDNIQELVLAFPQELQGLNRTQSVSSYTPSYDVFYLSGKGTVGPNQKEAGSQVSAHHFPSATWWSQGEGSCAREVQENHLATEFLLEKSCTKVPLTRKQASVQSKQHAVNNSLT